MFYIVELTDTDKEGNVKQYVAVVPPHWYNSDDQICCWPAVRDVQKLVKEKHQPRENWKWYPSRILRAVETYELAHAMLSTAEVQSDLSDVENSPTPAKRVANVPLRYLSSPSPPISTKKFKHKDIPKPPTLQINNHLGNSGPSASQGSPESAILDLCMDVIDHGNTIEGFEMNTNVLSVVTSNEPDESTHMEGTTQNFVLVPEDQQNNFVQNNCVDQSTKIIELLDALTVTVDSLKRQVQNMDNKIDRILRQGLASPSPSVPKVLKQRFSNTEEFEAFENLIQGSEETRAQLESQLVQYGGNSSADCVNRIFKEIFTNQLAKFYSLYGLKNNLNFSNSPLMPIIMDAIRSHKLANVTDKIIMHSIGEWFRHSGDRVKQDKKEKQ